MIDRKITGILPCGQNSWVGEPPQLRVQGVFGVGRLKVWESEAGKGPKDLLQDPLGSRALLKL